MQDQIDAADFVLVVATETYERRFRGHEEPGKGLGVRWEGAILTQELYEAGAKTTNFVPVVFSPRDAAHMVFSAPFRPSHLAPSHERSELWRVGMVLAPVQRHHAEQLAAAYRASEAGEPWPGAGSACLPATGSGRLGPTRWVSEAPLRQQRSDCAPTGEPMSLVPQTLAVSLFAALFLTPAGAPGSEENAAGPPRPHRPAGPDPAARPNVFLIVIDTVRADHLSAYGYRRQTSPHIDRLAEEGVLYENCISAGSWTLPAHASLFTGLFPRDHHTTSENQTLDGSYETLAELLRESHYHTAGFSNNVWTHDNSGLKQGFDTFLELWREQVTRKKGISFDDPALDMGAAKANEEIFAWLDGLPDKSRPFFVFINYFEPHLPYRPTRPHDDDFLPEGIGKETVKRLRSFYSPREYGYILNAPLMDVSDKEIEILTTLYDGEIAYVDSIIGQLVEGLRSRGLLDNTLLVITSDHGEHLGDHHMLGHKLSVYDPLLRVPLILWNPGRIPAGVRVKTQVQAHDVFGTILDLSGARAGFVPRLPFEDRAHDYTFAELAYPRIFLEVVRRKMPGTDTRAFARALKVVRGQRYKLIWGSDGSLELYDIVNDPNESRNLAETQPVILEEMQKVLESFNDGTLRGKR